MGLVWPHRVTVHAPPAAPSGSHGEDDVWTEDPQAEPVLVYEGLANVHDGRGRKFGAVSGEGTPLRSSDAVCYLKKKRAAASVPEGATVVVDWRDGTPSSDAVVVGVSRAENRLDLRRV